MPRVPTYGKPKVALTELPGARVSTGVPQDAFAVEEPLDLRAVQEVLGKVVAQEREKADQIALTDAESQLADHETELLYNTKTGLLNRRGKDAFSAPEEFEGAWTKRVSEISKSLGNDRQKRAFDQASKRRRSDANRVVQRHVSGEIRQHDEEVTKSFVTNERNTAIASYNDAERVTLSIERQKQRWVEFGLRNGLSAERVAELTLDSISDTHTGVINRMLANDEDISAKKYFDLNKKELTGTDTVGVERALDEGSTRGESQRQADAIVRQFPTRAEALQEAAKIKDPKVRDMTEDRVNRFFSAQREIKREMQEDLYMRSTNMIDARPGVPARQTVPPHVWSRLSLDQRNALERRSTDDPDRPHDSKAYLQFLDLTPQQTAAMSQAEFETRYWSKFDKSHQEHAANIWASNRDAIRTGKGQKEKVVRMINLNQRILGTLKKNKLLDPNKSSAKYSDREVILRTEFTDEAVRQLEEWSAANGDKSPDGLKMQEILDRLVISKVFIDEPWANDPQKLGFKIKEDERDRAYVPIDKISKEERDRIAGLIRQNGRQVTDDKIQRAYAAHLLNDRARFNAIIKD